MLSKYLGVFSGVYSFTGHPLTSSQSLSTHACFSIRFRSLVVLQRLRSDLLFLVMALSTKTPNGMLPIPASATKKPSMTSRPPKTQGRAGLPKLRLILRRLPPGLTEDEFQTALGDEWKVGAGIVDWAAYKAGKILKE